MPRGPKGEKRPADVIGAAVMVGNARQRLVGQEAVIVFVEICRSGPKYRLDRKDR